MSVEVFLEGTRAIVTATFTDAADVPANPTAVVFTVLLPTGALQTYTWGVDAQVQNPAVGEFTLLLDVDAAGRYKVNAQGTGAIRAPAEIMFRVEESHVV